MEERLYCRTFSSNGKIFQLKTEELTVGRGKLHNEELEEFAFSYYIARMIRLWID
jgi:hypothetical protein